MILHSYYKGEKIRLSREIGNNDNVFTVLVGENGSGKSTLMGNIISSLMGQEIAPFQLTMNSDVVNIIAVSTNLFDRFPLEKQIKNASNNRKIEYSYIGSRGVATTDPSLSFLSRVFRSLLASFLYDESRFKIILNTLRNIGFGDFLEMKLSPIRSFDKVIKAMLESNYHGDDLTKINALKGKSLEEIDKMIRSVRGNKKVRLLIEQIVEKRRKRISVLINSRGVNVSFEHNEGVYTALDVVGALSLLELGFFQLTGVNVKKERTRMAIHSASSGEQCVILMLLAIASKIEDNSLVLIDEPEICLHPLWQTRYVQMLVDSFRQFKGCHFIIATHSPQIVSGLKSNNGFIVDVKNRSIHKSSDFYNKSIDFQLAQVFLAPGYKNEYLSRKVLSALTHITSQLTISQEQKDEYTELVKIKDLLSDHDPIKALLGYLSEALKSMTND